MNYNAYRNMLPYPQRGDPNSAVLREAFNTETARLEAIFKHDFMLELGIENHPKAELLFRKAWEMGHSNGYGEVVSIGQSLLELVS